MQSKDQAIAHFARKNLLTFCLALSPDFELNWHLELLMEKLEAVERGEIKRLMIFMPPRHGKSNLCSYLFPAWFIGRNPRKQIITSSYSHSLASNFGREVRNLINEPRYKLVFPSITLAEDSKAKDHFHIFDTNQDQTKGGVYIASGVGGSTTGYGADIFFIDDPHKDKKEAESQVIQETAYDWYKSVARTRLMPGGAIVLIQTRWCDGDLAGRILENEGGKWDIVSLPAIAEEDEIFRKSGEALWPARYDIDALNEIKSDIKDDFFALYQQNPINEETQEFKRAYFKYFKDDQCPSNLRIYTTVDLAISKKDSADETVIMTVGVAPNNVKYILEYTNARMDVFETIEEIFRHYDKYHDGNPGVFGVETVAYQAALVQLLKKEMFLRNKFFSIEEIKTSTNKEMKIRGLIHHYRSGAIYHRAGFCDTLESQLLRFPKGQHDDIIDALSMQINLWNAPLSQKPSKDAPKTLRQLMKENR